MIVDIQDLVPFSLQTRVSAFPPSTPWKLTRLVQGERKSPSGTPWSFPKGSGPDGWERISDLFDHNLIQVSEFVEILRRIAIAALDFPGLI